MKFSIIIPTLNEEKTIENCLNSIKKNGFECEIIVVDGGSSDQTVMLADPVVDKGITFEKGRAKQMNYGSENATGEILVFLHADTLLPSNALNEIEQAIPFKQGVWGRFDIQLSGKMAGLPVVSALMNWRSRLTGIATGDQVIFISKKLFEKIGGYPDILLMEDISLCAQLKKISPPLCLTEKVISSGRRWETRGLIKTILLMWSLRLRYFFGENTDTLSMLYSRGLFWKP